MDEFDDEPELEQWQEIPEGRSGHGEIYRKFEDVGFTLSTVTGPGPGSPHIFIQRVFPGSEAHHRGVQIGSELLEINVVSAESIRSEEHTSELQSRGQLVFRLLLEKKKLSLNL